MVNKGSSIKFFVTLKPFFALPQINSNQVKCSGTMPCAMCSRKGLQCEFSLKQKPGPKVERGLSGGSTRTQRSIPVAPTPGRAQGGFGSLGVKILCFPPQSSLACRLSAAGDGL